MTGDAVTRSGANLDTDFAKAWLAAPTDPNVVMADGVNVINCDNCHQVHEANTNSYTFILDTAEVNVGAPPSTSTATWEVAPYDATVVVPVPAGIGGDHNQFCAECHPFN